MKRPLLSILIPTVFGREKEYSFIEEVIRMQCVTLGEEPLQSIWHGDNFGGWHSENIEYLYYRDDKSIIIGEKRELLYKAATGIYSWQIDDDDSISGNAIGKILSIINKSRPSCITFLEFCVIDFKEFTSSHSIDYPDWGEKEHGFDYIRTPYFKDVILTSIAQSVPVPHIRFGEDHEWSRLLKPFLKTEVHIPEFIYFYTHTSSDSTERYGLNKS